MQVHAPTQASPMRDSVTQRQISDVAMTDDRTIFSLSASVSTTVVALPVAARLIEPVSDIVMEMGSNVKRAIFEEHIQLAVRRWHKQAKATVRTPQDVGESSSRSSHVSEILEDDPPEVDAYPIEMADYGVEPQRTAESFKDTTSPHAASLYSIVAVALEIGPQLIFQYGVFHGVGSQCSDPRSALPKVLFISITSSLISGAYNGGVAVASLLIQQVAIDEDCRPSVKMSTRVAMGFAAGEHEAKSEVKIVPSQMRAIPKMIDTKSLQELLSTPVICTITLSELLKIRPHLWEEMGKHLETKEIKISLQTNPSMEEKKFGDQTKAQPVRINKVGDYCEGEEGNTTLRVEYNVIKTIAILDSGTRIAIATKHIWEEWGRPVLKKTRMKLQLVDGYVEKPLGILDQIIVTSCGIDYEHTFVVVDFGKTNNFDIILGRLFMRQLKMIQDWGYDQIYLRYKELVTKINMKYHSYRDVAKTPV
ncbi:hypothetical protein L7F22_041414 [Adiantum nelumboides]|nr:hypothetical protein [Adiantum nelumboides]